MALKGIRFLYPLRGRKEGNKTVIIMRIQVRAGVCLSFTETKSKSFIELQ